MKQKAARGEIELLLCDKCDVIISYIYMNTTRLVFPLSYVVRLDCFSNAVK